jgi:predicted acylesterase/phospholipase RssA
MKVNCIFQGGGANLATLLCSVEALGELEDEGFLSILEVAGTSAGSIAAACISHPKPNRELIQRVISIASDHVQDFRLPSTRVGLASKIVVGAPLLDDQKLEQLVRKFFDIDGNSFGYDDAKYPIKICAADIKRSTPVIFKLGSEKPLEEAITDSCAIPFVFRSHKSRSALADGGVMANLLDQTVFEKGDAHTLAFSFGKSGVSEINGLMSFAKTVVGSMMENAVNEAKIRILNSGGYVCELPSLFDTLDFEGALLALKDDAFRREVVEKCKVSIKRGLEGFHSNSSLLAYGDRVSQLQTLTGRIYDAIKVREPYRVIECAIICESNCLFGGNDGRSRNPDLQIKRVVIEPLANAIQLFRVGIAKGSDFRLMNEISCSVVDQQGSELKADFEVSSNTENGEVIHRLCVVLEEQHMMASGPITVSMTTTHQKGLMEGLKKPGGNEWMRAEAHRDDEIGTQDFILLVPKDFRSLFLSDLRDNVRRCSEGPNNLKANEPNWAVGRPMTEEELKQRLTWLHVDPAYRYIGWRAEKVTGRSSSGVLIEPDVDD